MSTGAVAETLYIYSCGCRPPRFRVPLAKRWKNGHVQHQIFLLRELVKRDFKGRYAGSLLGFFWSFVQPLWQLLLFSFVFATVMKIPLTGQRTENFAIFLFCGILPWMAIHEGVLRASTAVTDNASLVKKLNFPSQILVVTVVLAALVHEAIAASVFVVFLAAAGDLSWANLPYLLLALPLQLALTLGLGLLLCPVHVFFRDTAQVLGMFFVGWFYFTPIVYPMSMVPFEFRPFLELNPLTALVGLYRLAFLGGELGSVDGLEILIGAALLLPFLGGWIFFRLKASLVDEL